MYPFCVLSLLLLWCAVCERQTVSLIEYFFFFFILLRLSFQWNLTVGVCWCIISNFHDTFPIAGWRMVDDHNWDTPVMVTVWYAPKSKQWAHRIGSADGPTGVERFKKSLKKIGSTVCVMLAAEGDRWGAFAIRRLASMAQRPMATNAQLIYIYTKMNNVLFRIALSCGAMCAPLLTEDDIFSNDVVLAAELWG